ncbi:MAG: hypothetical protein EOP51_13840, partial [Sphingobacteriales bacterium]
MHSHLPIFNAIATAFKRAKQKVTFSNIVITFFALTFCLMSSVALLAHEKAIFTRHNSPVGIAKAAGDKAPANVKVKYAGQVNFVPYSLENITVSAGTLSPAFNSDSLFYTDTVSFENGTLLINPITSPGFSAYIYNQPVPSGGFEATLFQGDNPITIDVFGAGHTFVVSYTVTITRLESTNSKLSSIALSYLEGAVENNIALSPSFSPDDTTYTATADKHISNITLKLQGIARQEVYVNGDFVGENTISTDVPVVTGPNDIVVKVIAPDRVTTTNYHVAVQVPSDVNLQSLYIDNSAEFDPAFNPDSTSYDITVAGTKKTITITPTSVESENVIKVKNAVVPSGESSEEIPLALGANVIPIVVKGADSTSTKTYTLNVNRNGSTQAGLSALTVTNGSLTPTFSTAVTNYSMNVDALVEYIGVTPTAIDPNSTILVDDYPVASGQEEDSYYLYEGPNTVKVEVTASDGETVKTYEITVNRATPVYPEIEYDPSYIFTTGVAITPVVPDAKFVDPPSAGYTEPTIITDNIVGVTNLVLDADENIYAATEGASAGLYEIPYFGPTRLITSQLSQVFGMVLNPAGDLFVSDISGTYTTLFKIAAGSSVATPIGHGFDRPAGMAMDADGNIYVANSGSGVISKLLASDNYNTVESIAQGFAQPIGLSLDANKNIYITETVNGNVIKLLAAGNYLTTDTLVTGSTYPMGIKVDAVGNIFVAQVLSQKIVKYPAGGGQPSDVVTNIASPTGINFTADGSVYYGSVDIIGVVAPLGGYYIDKPLPGGLTFNDSTGVISGTPLAVSPTTTYTVTANNAVGYDDAEFDIEVTAGNAQLDSLVLSKGTLTPAFDASRFTYTTTVDSADAVIHVTPYASDAAATIKVNDEDVVSGSPSQDIALDEGSNTVTVAVASANGLATKTYSITVYRGNVFPQVSYGGGAQVYETDVQIVPLTPSGINVDLPGYGCVPDSLTSAIDYPFALTADGQGNLYSSSFADGKIYKINAAGNATLYSSNFQPQSNLAANNAGDLFISHYSTDTIYKIPAGGGPAVSVATGLAAPNSIAVDNSGNIYISDNFGDGTGALKRINAGTGDIVTLNNDIGPVIAMALDASRNVYTGSGDGEIRKFLAADNYSTSVLLMDDAGIPGGITVDAANNAYVTDVEAGVISRITPAGVVEPFSYCSYAPTGLAIDNKGKLYVAEFVISYISYFNPTGGYHLSPTLPQGLLFNDTTGVISGTPILESPAKSYTVTAYNEFGSGQATINIKVISGADLSKLGLKGVTIAPAFSPETILYTAKVTGTTTSIQLRPTASNPAATITVNGVPVLSGELSGNIPLDMGLNPILVVVTAANGVSTKTYTVNVGRGAKESRLRSITALPSATLATAGNTDGTINYIATVGVGIDNITLRPIARDLNAIVVVNDVIVPRGTSTLPISLELTDTTIIRMVITAQDGISTSTYAIQVVHGGSGNANLKLVTVTPSSVLTAGSGPGDVNYTTYVDEEVTQVKVRGVAADKNVIMTVNTTPILSSQTSGYIQLEETGPTLITFHVIAPNGLVTKDYTITINRTRSNNAKLKSIVLLPTATLVSEPATETINYSTSVDANATQIQLKPTAQQKFAAILVNDVPVASGATSGYINLEPVGPTVINILVTASDGVTQQGYTVTVNRNGSNNAKLASVKLDRNSIVSVSGTLGYTASVDASFNTVTVKPQSEDKNATVTVNGVTVRRGLYSPTITLNEFGATLITIVVRAQDGVTVNEYTLSVRRDGSNNTRLVSVTLTPNVTVSKPLSISYTATVNSSTETVGVAPLPEDNQAAVTVNGILATPGNPVQVDVNTGANAIAILVTAQDGTTKAYTLTITRSAMEINSIQNYSAKQEETIKRAYSGTKDAPNNGYSGYSNGFPGFTFQIMRKPADVYEVPAKS